MNTLFTGKSSPLDKGIHRDTWQLRESISRSWSTNLEVHKQYPHCRTHLFSIWAPTVIDIGTWNGGLPMQFCKRWPQFWGWEAGEEKAIRDYIIMSFCLKRMARFHLLWLTKQTLVTIALREEFENGK